MKNHLSLNPRKSMWKDGELRYQTGRERERDESGLAKVDETGLEKDRPRCCCWSGPVCLQAKISVSPTWLCTHRHAAQLMVLQSSPLI